MIGFINNFLISTGKNKGRKEFTIKKQIKKKKKLNEKLVYFF